MLILIMHHFLPSLLVSVSHFHHLLFASVYNMYPFVFVLKHCLSDSFITFSCHSCHMTYDMNMLAHTSAFIFTRFINYFIQQNHSQDNHQSKRLHFTHLSILGPPLPSHPPCSRLLIHLVFQDPSSPFPPSLHPSLEASP